MSLRYMIIALFMLSINPFVLYAQSTTVCNTCSVTSISEAISTAKAHDTLYVHEGVYFESDILIDKPITLKGLNYPVIDGQEKGSILKIAADSVSIFGFKFRSVGFSHIDEYAAIHISNSEHFHIEDNSLEAVFFGILIERAKYGTINNNTISGDENKEFYSGNGVHAWHSSNLFIAGNRLEGVRDGIYLEFVDSSQVINNVSQNNIRYGLHFMFSNHNDYGQNEFVNNGAGVAVMFSKFIKMKENRFYQNWGTSSFGLLLKEIYDAEIVGNIFEENTTAIQVDGSSRLNYTANDFIRNGWAVKIAGGCYSNVFKQNNFTANSFDISYKSKINDNKFEGNYWSSYSGYDLNKDGIGDVPYHPVKLFSHIVNQSPESIVLIRSLFIDILNFSEKVAPVFTPVDLVDQKPKMTLIQ